MNNKDLLTKILNAKNDAEKVEILKKELKGMKLYRYRPYIRDKQEYEVESTKNNTIWASRPDKFDDDYEGTIVFTSKNDVNSIFDCVKEINKNDAKRELEHGFVGSMIRKKQGSAKMDRLLEFFENIEFQNREKKRKAKRLVDCKCLDEFLREYRNTFAVSCFSENDPLKHKNMWQQYALNKDGTIAGFCLEYDIEDILNNGYVICPVYYKDNTTISDLCSAFNNHLESVFLHKNTQGFDKEKDPRNKKLISWENQREWRIVINNREQKDGLLLEKQIIPKKLYYLKDSPCIEDILNVFSGEKQMVDIHTI